MHGRANETERIPDWAWTQTPHPDDKATECAPWVNVAKTQSDHAFRVCTPSTQTESTPTHGHSSAQCVKWCTILYDTASAIFTTCAVLAHGLWITCAIEPQISLWSNYLIHEFMHDFMIKNIKKLRRGNMRILSYAIRCKDIRKNNDLQRNTTIAKNTPRTHSTPLNNKKNLPRAGSRPPPPMLVAG